VRILRGVIILSTKESELEQHASFIELKQENEILHEKLDQYHIMFEQSLDAIVLLDSNSCCFTGVNHAACQLFELPKEKLIGQNLHGFLMLESDQSTATIKKTLNEEGSLKGELTIRVQSGKVKHVEFSARKNAVTGIDVSVMRDVSSKRILEKQRNVSKQLFMDVYNRAVDGIVIFDRTGRFTNCNNSFITSFDLSKEELLKLTLYDFVEPEYMFKLEKLWKILDEKEKAKGELPVKLKNGVRKVFEFTTTANIFDNYYMSIMRDVTEKKNMEKRLQNSELRFREIFDSAIDAIVIWDQEGRIIRANNSASKTFEMPIDKLSKQRIFDFVDQKSPAFIEMTEELFETGKVRAELDFSMVNGQVKRLEFTSTYKALDDYNMTIFRNVSETRLMEQDLREKEQKFRKIFEGSLDGIVLSDENLRIIDVNPAASKILKVQREQLLSKRMDQIITSSKSLLFEENLANNDMGEGYVELPLILIDGEEKIIELAIKRNVVPKLNMAIFRDEK
jgi:two-component system, sporulation sensor kinase E